MAIRMDFFTGDLFVSVGGVVRQGVSDNNNNKDSDSGGSKKLCEPGVAWSGPRLVHGAQS